MLTMASLLDERERDFTRVLLAVEQLLARVNPLEIEACPILGNDFLNALIS